MIDIHSDHVKIICGVPQDPILRPMLLNLNCRSKTKKSQDYTQTTHTCSTTSTFLPDYQVSFSTIYNLLTILDIRTYVKIGRLCT